MQEIGLRRILDKIKEYETICLFGHIRPDGDCLGSQFGLKDIIQTTFPDKKVYVIGQPSSYVRFLGEPDVVPEFIFENALGIVVDTGSVDRISDPNFSKCKELIKIDHHHPVGTYGDIIWIEEDWPACAQMVTYFFELFKEELRISKKGAEALYTGIVTDTGGFRYRGVDGLTLQLAGKLVSYGANPSRIEERLSMQDPKLKDLKGYVLTNMKREPFGFAYIILSKSVMERFNVSYEEAASMISELGGMRGFPIWAIILEYPNEYRVRLRSFNNGPTVHDIAEKFGGGGHDNAAGCNIANVETKLDEIKFVCQQAIEDWRAKRKKAA